MQIRLSQYPEIRDVIRAAFPDYKKHTCRVDVVEKVGLHGTYWSGGTRSEYTAVSLVSKKAVASPQFDPPCYGGPESAPEVILPPNTVVVEGGMFCGKKREAVVFIRPDNIALLIPEKGGDR